VRKGLSNINPKLLLLVLTCLIGKVNAQVHINEFMAKNSASAVDPDFGRFSDFIELYNPTGNPFSLKDFTITDNPDNKTKWRFPDITIASGEYLILWADGQNKIIGDTAYSPFLGRSVTMKNHHLGFRLSGDGEYIGIFNLSLQTVDELHFTVQEDDISYGRNPANPNEWLYFSEVTAGAMNSLFGAKKLEYATPPVFSLKEGFYSTQRNIQISSPATGAVVRFTFDGSTPTQQSPVFPGSFNVIRNYTVKARAYEPGKLPSKVVTKTYFIGENINLPVISISSNQQHLYGFDFGIYRNGIKDREVPATFEYFDENKQSVLTTGIGLRIFGTTIFALPQRPLSIRFRSKFGESEFDYPLFTDRSNKKFRSIQLRNGGNDYNVAYFRDGLATSILKGQMDVDYQAYKPCVVFINGEYMGIYEIRERLDKDYIGKNHLIDPDNIDMLEDSLIVVEGTGRSYISLINFLNNNDISQPENYEAVSRQINIHEYINYMIQRVFIGYQIADYNNKFWRSREPGSKWRWIAHDMEHAFGQIAGDQFFENTLSKVSGQSGNLPEWSVLVFKKLLGNKSFRDEFAQRMAIYLQSIYKPSRTIAITDSLRNMISPQMSRHIFRWNTPVSIIQWNNKINFIKDFLNKRTAFVRLHVAGQFGLADSALVRIEIQGKGKIEAAGVIISDTIYSAHLFKGAGLSLKAIPNAGNRFIRWEGVTGDSSFVVAEITSDTLIRVIFSEQNISIIPPLVAEDTVLSAALSPWYGLEDVLVLPGARLVVEAGATLLMTDGVSFHVQGGLHLNGTEDKRITLISDPSPAARKGVLGQRGFWGSIMADNPPDSIIIQYTDIRHGSLGKNRNRHFSTISTYNTPVVISHSTIMQGKAPLISRGGSLYIGHSEINTPVSCNGYVSAYDMNDLLIEHCVFNGNRAFDTDAIDIKGVKNGVVRNNVIRGFTGSNSDGIDLGIYSENILIEGNIISDCFDKGISIGSQSTGIIRRNVIYGCDLGVAVKDSLAFADIDQNTFYANRHDVACYEKSTTRGGGKADVKNSIMAASTASNISFDILSEIAVRYSLSDSELIPGEGNLKGDPLLVSPSTGNFELQPNSPCIDAGDPESPTDPDGSRADMGAYYTHTGYSGLTVHINEFSYQPPSNYFTGDWVEIYNSTTNPVNLEGWTLLQGKNTFQITPPLVLEPKAYFVFVEDSVLFRKIYGAEVPVLGGWDFDLDDQAGAIILQDAQQQTVHYVRYANTWPYPPLAAGKGATVELEIGKQGNKPSEWRESYVLNGTPGTENSRAVFISDIFVNEVMASNSNTIADEFGEYDDWLEVFNAGEDTVNIAGLYISDNLSNPRKWQLALNEPHKTSIPPKGFLVIWADEQTEQGILHADFKLSASGERVAVFQRKSDDFESLDMLEFGIQTNEATYGRFPDGSSSLSQLKPTPLAPNALRTGVDDYAYYTLRVYPNPFSETCMIQTQEVRKPYHLEILSISGQQLILQSGLSSDQWSLNGAALESGLYLYRIQGADGKIFTGKLSKM
jgi:parallel beta-helix repeat protein